MLDVPHPEMLNGGHGDVVVILDGGIDDIQHIELRQYIAHTDRRGPYSIITAYIRTDQDTIEMLYDEGYRGEDALKEAATFLMNMVGVSALVTRARIVLSTNSKKTGA